MEWIKDISSTVFFPLTIGVCLVLTAFLCAACGQKRVFLFGMPCCLYHWDSPWNYHCPFIAEHYRDAGTASGEFSLPG